MKFQGFVRRKRIRRGTKSEHDALVLTGPGQALKLRRPGGNAFWDEALAQLEDKEISAEGEVDGSELFLSSWKVIG